jgi:uncharacterized alkaline shock family protein YloU
MSMATQEDLGNITINDDVVARIASLAIFDVEGVVSMSGRSSYSDYVGSKTKDVEKGISVKIDPETNLATVNVEINIVYGVSVYDTARKLQRAVKNAVESLTGLTVDKVNVTIRGLEILEQTRPTPKNKAA